MSKKKKIIIVLIAVILIIAAIVTFFIIKSKKSSGSGMPQNGMQQFMKDGNGKGNMDQDFNPDDEDGNFNSQSENSEDSNFNPSSEDENDSNFKEMSDKLKEQNKTTLKTQAEVKSALTENVELHATYYLEEVYVEANQFVSAGENILKYTNGTYLVAPYDCYIIKLNLPEVEGKALNSHYVEISSSNSLMVTMSVDESNINNVSVGTEATIEISSLGKTYTGNVTHIASTGSNGKFEIEIEFENDGDVMIGMTSTVSITI